ncbi:ornithine carbamoyltransferase [Desulfatiferula olefinivorans]
MKKDLLSLYDLEPDDFDALFNRALDLKKRHQKGIFDQSLAGKSVGMIFDKPSTRTRISFEAATIQLAGTPIFMNAADTQISRNEPVSDTARVLSRYIDCLVVRTFSQELIEEYATHCTIPVVNALSDLSHPCQILSDLLTIIEYKGGYKDVTIAWVGDGNNVAHSWINAAAVLGFDLALACPEGYTPNPDILDRALSRKTGTIRVTADPAEAVAGADIVYTDVWASMGQESEAESRMALFRPYQVTADLLKKAKDDVCVMHCLPAHRDEEISAEVLEGKHSIVWDQAENKLHMHKAILETLIANQRNQ